MEVVSSNTGYSLDGVALSRDMLNVVCAQTKIPQTLLSIDKKEGTNFFNTLLSSRNDFKAVVENGAVVGFIKEGQEFLSKEDVKFSADLLARKFNSEVVHRSGQYFIPISDPTNILGDLYHKELVVDRAPTGGLFLCINALRLICTNGSQIVDRSVRKHLQSGVTRQMIDSIYEVFNSFSIKKLISSAMTDSSGKMINASVADVFKFSDILMPYTDVAGVHALADEITAQYIKEGVDVTKYNRSELSCLDSGIPYYKVFNVMTADARAVDLSQDTRIKIGNCIRPSRVIFSSSLNAPTIDPDRLSVLMGDTSNVVNQ